MHARTLLSLLTAFTINACSGPIVPPTCGENPGKHSLVIFIGEKISVSEAPVEPGSMDGKFVARFKILERVCGDYTKDTIEFVAYDHYGTPAFADYDTVLLYVAKWDSGYYHLKYQFDPLYKTKGGQWASPHMWYHSSPTDSSKHQPAKIDFARTVSYSLAGFKKAEARQRYPSPYYERTADSATAIYGYYLPDVIALKKEGVLHWRGYFGKIDSTTVELQDIELEEVVSEEESKRLLYTPAEKKQLIATWRQLLAAIDKGEAAGIRSLSSDSVLCAVCEGFGSSYYYNEPEPIDTFTRYAQLYFPGTVIDTALHKGNYKIWVSRYAGEPPPHYQFEPGESRLIYKLIFQATMVYNSYRHRHSINILFVKEKGQFWFYGMTME